LLFDLLGHSLQDKSGTAGCAILFTMMPQKVDDFPMGVCQLNLLPRGQFERFVFSPFVETFWDIAVFHSHGVHLWHCHSPVVLVGRYHFFVERPFSALGRDRLLFSKDLFGHITFKEAFLSPIGKHRPSDKKNQEK
jgi:hypothetical protein